MKAARVERPGGGLVLRDVPEPEPSEGEVVVRVAASGVCGSDVHIVEGRLQRVAYPLTIGHEPAGYVHRVGKGVTQVREGQRVGVYPTTGCGRCRFCASGRENLCPEAKAVGFETDGSHAEYLLVPSERNLVPLEKLDPVQAAPLSCAGVTAYSAIKKYVVGRVTPLDSVLVIGVGGLGHIAVQLLARLTPATIAAVDIDEKKLAMARRLGAGLTFRDAAAEEVRNASGGRVAAALDFVGSDTTLNLGYDSLDTAGTMVVMGAAGGTLPFKGPDPRQREVVGPIMGSTVEFRELIQLAERGEVKVEVKTFSLQQAKASLEMLRRGEILGRAVIAPPGKPS